MQWTLPLLLVYVLVLICGHVSNPMDCSCHCLPPIAVCLPAYCREDLNARMPGYQVNMGFGLHVGECYC